MSEAMSSSDLSPQELTDKIKQLHPSAKFHYIALIELTLMHHAIQKGCPIDRFLDWAKQWVATAFAANAALEIKEMHQAIGEGVMLGVVPFTGEALDLAIRQWQGFCSDKAKELEPVMNNLRQGIVADFLNGKK